MNVLWLSNVPSPYRVDFFNMLGERIKIKVLFERDTASDRDKNWTAGNYKNFEAIILNGIRTGADKALCLNILRWLKKDNEQIIIISNYSTPTGILAIEWLRFKRIPFAIQADGGFFKGGIGIKEKWKRHLISSAKFWLSSGRHATKYFEAYGAKKDWIFESPFSSIMTTDILKNKPTVGRKQQLRQMLGIRGDKVAVSVGQFIHRKGFDVLIRAWSHMNPGYTLLIIGGGELEPDLAEMIRKNSLENVLLLGFKPKEELYKYYTASDLFILPTREDIWGLVINEAMAFGLPVITTDKCIAGMELIEDNKNGFIVEVENEAELYKKVEFILSHDDIREAMSEYSLNKIRNFTVEEMVKAHMAIFHEIINASQMC
jgi:glycosyltransferase involved in cell wall biosynthesis